MSEFKFACPVCGQHITADSEDYGARIECPTCFQKIIVPQAPTTNGSTLILTASQPHAHHLPLGSESPHVFRRPFLAGSLVTLAVAAVALAGTALAWKAFRAKIHKPDPRHTSIARAEPRNPAATNLVAPPANSTNWTLELDGVTIPEDRAAGRINGRDFICQRATLMGGMLTLRQGRAIPPDFGLTIILAGRPGEELAGQTFIIDTNRANAPPITLRWRDAQQSLMTRTVNQGYAMRLEFGEVADNRMPAKIYLCLPDELKSYVVGTNEVEIRRPTPPRLPQSSRRGQGP